MDGRACQNAQQTSRQPERGSGRYQWPGTSMARACPAHFTCHPTITCGMPADAAIVQMQHGTPFLVTQRATCTGQAAVSVFRSYTDWYEVYDDMP